MWNAWYRGVTHAVLVVKTWPKKQLRRARPRWDNTVRVDFKKLQFVWIGFDWLRQKPEVGFPELGNELLRSAKYENFWISWITVSFWRDPFSGVLSLWRFYVLKLLQVFFVATALVGLGTLILEVSISHSETPHSVESSGRDIGPFQISLHENTTTFTTDIHGNGRFELAIPAASQRPLTHTRNRATTRMGYVEVAPLSNALAGRRPRIRLKRDGTEFVL